MIYQVARMLPNRRFAALACGLCLAAAGPALAQPQPQPVLTRVTITSPAGTPQSPFRTNRDLISLEFTSDAANGIFFATSVGAEIPMSTFLVNTATGSVGAGLLSEGIKNLQVTVANANAGNTGTQLRVTSPPVTVILDRTPPILTITQIRLRPNGLFEGFSPNRIYRTNADQITLRGFVNDGATGVPPPQISIATAGVIQPATATPDASGSWELTVGIAQEPEGPIDLRVVANDNVGGAREGNRSEAPVGLR
jgi:hypothetical protein